MQAESATGERPAFVDSRYALWENESWNLMPPLSPPPTNSPRFSYWLPRIASALLVPILLFGLVEGALRLFGVGVALDPTRPCVVDGKATVCDNFAFAAVFLPPGMLRSPRPYAFPPDKPAGTYRIVVMGESAAYGDPDPAYGFSRYLEVMLRQRYPGINFEVINSSITATNSHAMPPIVRDMTKYHTDLFISYTGSNEVVGPFGAGTVFTSTKLPLPLIRGTMWFNSTRIGQLLSRARASDPNQRKQWRGMEMFLSQQLPADSPALASVYGNFEANLRDAIAAARRGGAQVLLSTVVTNLKDCAPFASAHRKDLKADDLKNWNELGEQGVWKENAGDFQGALQLYRKAEAIDPDYAELQFRIARCLWALGDYNGAGGAYAKARDLDTLRFRADTRDNEIVRKLGTQSGQGVGLVDSEAVLANASPHGVIGGELLCDHVHLTPEGNYLLARAMLEQIAKMLPADVQAKAASGSLATEDECDRRLALTRYDRARLASENLQRLQRPPFTSQINHQEQIMRLGAMVSNPETPQETLQQYEWAISQAPNDTMLHLNLGRFLSNFIREAALGEFRKARPYNDVPFVAPDGTLVR